MDKLLQHPIVVVLGIIGGICSIVALPLAIWFFLKSKREKHPRYAFNSQVLIRGLSAAVPGLKITYSGFGEPLSDFTVTRFYFWNAGRATIYKADIPKTDPLCIKIDEPYHILNCQILKSTSPANNVSTNLDREKRNLQLTFDYLDRNDGVVIQIIHNSTQGEHIKMHGKVIEFGAPDEVEIQHIARRFIRMMAKLSSALVVVIFAIIFLMLLASPELRAKTIASTKNPLEVRAFIRDVATIFVSFIIYGAMSVVAFYLIRKNLLPLPGGLRGFDDHPFVRP